MPMSKRLALVEAYLEALEARALLIHAGPNGQPAKISFSADPKLDLFDALWFAKPAHAELVLMRSRDDLAAIGALRPQGWVDLSAREVRDTIVNVASLLGATWRTAAMVEATASSAVEEIIAHVEAQRTSGGLSRVNSAYKIYRQQQLEKGEKSISYSAHMAAFTRSLVVLAAKNANMI